MKTGENQKFQNKNGMPSSILCENAVSAAVINRSLKIEKWLNSKEAAQYLNISERTLFNLTSNGKIPYHKFGRRNRYLLEDLRNLLSAQRRGGQK